MTGFCDSVCVPVGILYISEVTHTTIRGASVNSTGVFVGLGVALAYAVGGCSSWRVATLVPAFVSLMAAPIFVIMKETPTYMLTNGQDALYSLNFYRESA